MLQEVKQTDSRGLERTCQAVSPMDDPCDSLATYYCEKCGQSFCATERTKLGTRVSSHRVMRAAKGSGSVVAPLGDPQWQRHRRTAPTETKARLKGE
jgi:hypothetical protein